MSTSSTSPDPSQPDPHLRGRVIKRMLAYTGLRLLLVIVLAAAIVGIGLIVGTRVPVLVALLLGLLLALPVSMLVLKNMRAEMNADIAQWDAQRRAHREYVSEQLEKRQNFSAD